MLKRSMEAQKAPSSAQTPEFGNGRGGGKRPSPPAHGSLPDYLPREEPAERGRHTVQYDTERRWQPPAREVTPPPPQRDNHVVVPHISSTILGEIPKMKGNFPAWREELQLWVTLNSHLSAGQRLAILMLSLKGEAKIVANQHYRAYPETTVEEVLRVLRKHYIPNEAQYSMEKLNALWGIRKDPNESTAVFITRFDQAVNRVRVRGIDLDEKLVFTQCISALKPDNALMATIVAQCPNQRYDELREYMLVYSAIAEKRKKENHQPKSHGKGGKSSETRKAYHADAVPSESIALWANKGGKGKGTSQKGQGKGNGGTKACWTCGKEGHLSDKCPNNGVARGQETPRPLEHKTSGGSQGKQGKSQQGKAQPLLCWKCGKIHKKGEQCSQKVFFTCGEEREEETAAPRSIAVYTVSEGQFRPEATIDTAFNGKLLCSKKWLNHYIASLRKAGYREPVQYVPADNTNYIFGAGKKSPLTAAWIPMFTEGHVDYHKVQVVAAEIPLLMGLQMLVDGYAKIDIAERRIVLNGKSMPLSVNSSGHIALQIFPTGRFVSQSQRAAFLRSAALREDSEQEKSVLSAVAQYCGTEMSALSEVYYSSDTQLQKCKEGKERKLATLGATTAVVQKLFPKLRIPQKVIVSQREGNRIHPPTVAVDKPYHILVVTISGDGEINAYTNASDSNLFGYQIGEGQTEKPNNETALIYYYEEQDPGKCPVTPIDEEPHVSVMATTALPKTKNHVVHEEHVQQAITDISIEVSRMKTSHGRTMVIGKRLQGRKWAASAEQGVTDKLRTAVEQVHTAIYGESNIHHVQIIPPGHTNAPVSGAKIKLASWSLEQFGRDQSITLRNLNPRKTRTLKNDLGPDTIMLIMAQERAGAQDEIRLERAEPPQPQQAFQPLLRMPLPSPSTEIGEEDPKALKRMIASKDPKVKDLIDRFVYSDKNVASTLTSDTRWSGHDLTNEVELRKVASHVYNNLGATSWVRMQKFLKTMAIPKLLYEAVREKAKQEEAQAPLSKQPLNNVSSLPLSNYFNDVISIDVFSVGQYDILHTIDVKERYSMLQLLEKNDSEHCKMAIVTGWVASFGIPNFLLVDSGNPLLADPFASYVTDLGVTIIPVPVQAHHSIGLVERHHQAVKFQIGNLVAKLNNDGKAADIRELLAFAQLHHNWVPTGPDGFSPAQRLMGRNMNIPGLDLEHTKMPTLMALAEDGDPSKRILESHGLMAMLREEHSKADNSAKLARAISHRVRVDPRSKIRFGDWVYVYRRDKSHIKGKWTGPARIVGGHSRMLLVELAGKLYRTSTQFISHVESVKECVGAHESDTLGEPIPIDQGYPVTTEMTLQEDTTLPPTLVPIDDMNESWEREEATLNLPREPEEPYKTEVQGSLEGTREFERNEAINLPKEPTIVGHAEGIHAQTDSEVNAERSGIYRTSVCEPSNGSYSYDRERDESDIVAATQESRVMISREIGVSDILYDVDVSEWAKFAEKGKTVPNRHCQSGAWLEAKRKELAALYTYDAVENVTEKEVPKGVKILDSLWVNTVKSAPLCKGDEVTEFQLDKYYKAKSRITARGDQEDVSTLLLSSPTADKAILRLVLACVPSAQWVIASVDITNAFLQGDDLPAERQVYVRPPEEVRREKPELIWRAKKCIYGLADAPRSWHMSLTDRMVQYGGKVSQHDPNVIIFHEHAQPGKQATQPRREILEVDPSDGEEMPQEKCFLTETRASEGVLVLFVDDILVAGTTDFVNQSIKRIESAYDVSKIEKNEFTHLGVKIRHDVIENKIEMTMPGYVDKITKMPLSPLREAAKDDKLTPTELRQFRGKLGQLAWLATNLRPDLAMECSILLSTDIKSEIECVSKDMEPEDVHKSLAPSEDKGGKPNPKETSCAWFTKELDFAHKSEGDVMVYKVKRKQLENPEDIKLTVNNVTQLNKAIGKAHSFESQLTFRDITLGKGLSDLHLLGHSDSSLLNSTKFTSQQGTTLMLTSKTNGGHSDEVVIADPLTKKSRKPLMVKSYRPANLIHWGSRRSKRVHISSFSAEAAGLLETCDYAIYIKSLLNEISFGTTSTIIGATVCTDQLAVVSNCVNLTVTSSEKRLAATFHYIREAIKDGDLSDVKFTPSDLNVSDPLTKPMQSQLLYYLISRNILITPDTGELSGKRRARRNDAIIWNSAKM